MRACVCDSNLVHKQLDADPVYKSLLIARATEQSSKSIPATMAFILPVIKKDQQLFLNKNKTRIRKPKSHSFAIGELAPAPSVRRPKSKSMSAATSRKVTPITQIEMKTTARLDQVREEDNKDRNTENETTPEKFTRKSSVSNFWSRIISPKEQSSNKRSRR